MLLHGLYLLSQLFLLSRARNPALRSAYPWFWGWVSLSIVRAALLLPFDPNSSSVYLQIWLITLWISLPLQFMVAWEWTLAIGTHFPGQGRVTHGILAGTCILAVALSVLSLQAAELEWRSGSIAAQRVAQGIVAQRFFGTALTLAMIAISAFYRFFGSGEIRCRENLSVQQHFLIAAWTLQAFSHWVVVVTDAEARQLVNTVLAVAAPILFATWALGLRPIGEQVQPRSPLTRAMHESPAWLKSFIERTRDRR
jgi:hypothetical protein